MVTSLIPEPVCGTIPVPRLAEQGTGAAVSTSSVPCALLLPKELPHLPGRRLGSDSVTLSWSSPARARKPISLLRVNLGVLFICCLPLACDVLWGTDKPAMPQFSCDGKHGEWQVGFQFWFCFLIHPPLPTVNPLPFVLSYPHHCLLVLFPLCLVLFAILCMQRASPSIPEAKKGHVERTTKSLLWKWLRCHPKGTEVPGKQGCV